MINWPDSGFTEKNIESLKNECRRQLRDHPAVCFVFLRLLTTIDDAFEGQAMDQDLHEAFTGLVPLFREAADRLDLPGLDNLVRRFNEIYER